MTLSQPKLRQLMRPTRTSLMRPTKTSLTERMKSHEQCVKATVCRKTAPAAEPQAAPPPAAPKPQRRRQQKVGRVVSDKMQKTIVVAVESLKRPARRQRETSHSDAHPAPTAPTTAVAPPAQRHGSPIARRPVAADSSDRRRRTPHLSADALAGDAGSA